VLIRVLIRVLILGHHKAFRFEFSKVGVQSLEKEPKKGKKNERTEGHCRKVVGSERGTERTERTERNRGPPFLFFRIRFQFFSEVRTRTAV